jgi:acetoin utilization deacetylase AcuC-like enzyme
MTTIYTFIPSQGHHFPDHPERPGRLDALRLEEIAGIQAIPALPATHAEAARVHTPGLLAALETTCRQGPGIIDYAPTYVTRSSFEDALLAAGAAISVARAVLDGTARNGFAIARPPGHHAEPGRAMGFCLFNNAAIAAREALALGLKRVAVIDFDVHHGNGTQAAFLDDPRCGYISTHQDGLYPGTGWLEDADSPGKRGRMINLPLPARTGDDGFALVLGRVIAPFVRSFRPDMLFISAGYDAHWRDPLAGLGLSTAGYAALSRGLVALAEETCQGRVVFLLEGGYDAHNVANGIRAGFAALTGHPEENVADPCPHPEPDITALLERAREWHGFAE